MSLEKTEAMVGTGIGDLAMVGEELTEDELSLVAGAARFHYIGKTNMDGEIYDDWVVVN